MDKILDISWKRIKGWQILIKHVQHHWRYWNADLGSVQCLVTQWCPTLCDLMDRGILQARILEWVTIPCSRESSQPKSPVLQTHSLPSAPPEKPKSTGVDSLSLLEGNFQTQKRNQGLLHGRQILYQLCYPGSSNLGYNNTLSYND